MQDSLVEYGARRVIITITAILCALLEIVDTTIVNVALNEMKGNLGATLSEVGWVITAKQDGYVSKIPVQVGQFLQAGAQLFSIVLNNDKWIVANFKETQLNKMVEGQKVEVKIDAFPDDEFEGVVSSISPATGSTFSLLPPDNASGNFVKVVQRVPVKITFKDLKPEVAKKLRAGMNVLVDVEVK